MGLLRGIRFCEHGWNCRMEICGEEVNLGYFNTEDEAYRVYEFVIKNYRAILRKYHKPVTNDLLALIKEELK